MKKKGKEFLKKHQETLIIIGCVGAVTGIGFYAGYKFGKDFKKIETNREVLKTILKSAETGWLSLSKPIGDGDVEIIKDAAEWLKIVKENLK